LDKDEENDENSGSAAMDTPLSLEEGITYIISTLNIGKVLRSCSKAVAASAGLQKLKQSSAQNDVTALFHMNSSWDYSPSNPDDLLFIFGVNGKLSACDLLRFQRDVELCRSRHVSGSVTLKDSYDLWTRDDIVK
jgi:hypothetical protein